MSRREEIEEKIKEIADLAQGIALPLGLDVLDVNFGQQGRRRSLEITIFRVGGRVSLSDCEQVSREIEAEFDRRAAEQTQVVEGPYALEVQSPGIDRQLKTEREFKLFAGQKVKVQTKEKVGDLGDTFTARLEGTADGKLLLEEAEAVRQKTVRPSLKPEKQAVALDLQKIINVRLYQDSFSPKTG